MILIMKKVDQINIERETDGYILKYYSINLYKT